MNLREIRSKAKYAIMPLVCLAAIAIAYDHAERQPREKAAQAKKKAGPAGLMDRLNPDAVETFTAALGTSLDKMDRLAAQRAAMELRWISRRLEARQIPLADARVSTKDSARDMLKQRDYRVEVGRIGIEISNPQNYSATKEKEQDWLDQILDANPRKFLLVVVGLLILMLILGAALGKAELRKVGWSIALILIAFLVVNQLWKSSEAIYARQNAASDSAKHQPSRQKNVITVEVSDERWSREITLLPSIPFTWDDQPGDLYFKFPNGKIIKTEKGGYADLGKMPSRKFRVKGTPGIVVFKQ